MVLLWFCLLPDQDWFPSVPRCSKKLKKRTPSSPQGVLYHVYCISLSSIHHQRLTKGFTSQLLVDISSGCFPSTSFNDPKKGLWWDQWTSCLCGCKAPSTFFRRKGNGQASSHDGSFRIHLQQASMHWEHKSVTLGMTSYGLPQQPLVFCRGVLSLSHELWSVISERKNRDNGSSLDF